MFYNEAIFQFSAEQEKREWDMKSTESTTHRDTRPLTEAEKGNIMAKEADKAAGEMLSPEIIGGHDKTKVTPS